MKCIRPFTLCIALGLLLFSCQSLTRSPQEGDPSSEEESTTAEEESSGTTDDQPEPQPEPEEEIIPLEVFFIDQENLPSDAGVPGTTYTAQVYVLDNIDERMHGPFLGSTFPNSQENPTGSDRPNRVADGPHYFNNLNGHKGQTRKGLNLVDLEAIRIVPGYSWTLVNTVVEYANVHSGFSDKGNYNSRGSQGCPTIHPDQVDDFMDLFDFSVPNWEDPPQFTLGTSEGIVYIFRADETTRNQLINEIESVYE